MISCRINIKNNLPRFDIYFDNKYSHRKGRSPNAIRNSYLDNLSTEDDFNKILEFFETNPNASKADVNYEIHKIHLAKCGIDIS